jgi:hypothetical protein
MVARAEKEYPYWIPAPLAMTRGPTWLFFRFIETCKACHVSSIHALPDAKTRLKREAFLNA